MLRFTISGTAAATGILLSQVGIPDPAKAIDAAAGHGWESAVLAVIVLGSFVAIGKLVSESFRRHDRQVDRTLDESAKREESLRSRVTDLEKMLGNIQAEQVRSLSNLLGTVNGTLARLTQLMESRPCVLSAASTVKFMPPEKAAESLRQNVQL